MLVYRISRTKFANDLTGEGARLHGGRWNHKGVPAVYTSGSRALAVLEYTVNVAIDDIPRALSLITLEIPEKEIDEISEAQLPGDWKSSPAPTSTKDFGSGLLNKVNSLIIKLPSAVIPAEFNYLINPLHLKIAKVLINHVEDFVYDIRIKVK